MPRAWSHFVIASVLSCFLPCSVGEAQSKLVRRVLIFNEVGTAYPGINLMDQGIRSALHTSSYKLEIYREYMDTLLFPDPADQQRFRDFYIRKYQNRKPDVIITVGPSPLKFMLETHHSAFPGVPIAFCLPTWGPGSPVLDSDFSGVENAFAPFDTIKAALRLQPSTKHIVVVGGAGAHDKLLEELVRDRLRPLESNFDLSYLTNLTMPDLVERLRRLPNDSIVLFTGMGQDAAGTKFISGEEAVEKVVAAANVPVFGMNDVNLGHGEVGGKVSYIREQGRIAGDIALRMLKGEKPQDIPRVRDTTAYMFDARALKRWGLKEKDLPTGSIILNRQPDFWELYWHYVLIGFSVLLVQTIAIGGLLWQRSRRRHAENEAAVAYDRLRVAVEAGRFVGWDVDYRMGTNIWFGDLQGMFGIQAEKVSLPIGEFLRDVHPEDVDHVRKAIEDAREGRSPYFAEFRIIPCDGRSPRWVNARGKFYYATNGDALRMLGMAVDVTERHQAEDLVRESEERFRLVANSAPVMIWMSATDKSCTYVNKSWLDFTGRPLEAQLGNGWAESVHPQDLQACMDTYTQAFDRRESYKMEYRAKRNDGEYRWILDVGVPRFSKDGSFAGYIGSCLDITDRRLAEEALGSVSHKLIEAQEKERTRIARELHDDINQRIALATIELDQLKQSIPGLDNELRTRMTALGMRLQETGTEVQAISHRLHSSKLELLGIVAASRSFCRELAGLHKVKIDFAADDIQGPVPQDVSLCAFRILQESLQNAIKYSGAKRIEVQLRATSGGIELTVHDDGAGFDVEEAMRNHGLGLISMRERANLVKGTLVITSKPMGGTVVGLRIPIAVNRRREAISGAA